jgi:phosphopantothenoylcysteine decarboxylase/phosphopantothenate--cysteine ligase
MSHLFLGAGASAALHKAVDLASELAQRGHAVRAVLTPRAAELVSPQLFEAVTGESAHVDEFGPARRGAMDHVELARWAEAVLVAPCTADLAARIALGLGGDLLTTALLAVEPGVPRLLCPSMNPTMFAHPAVVRNLEVLTGDGWRILPPDEGHVACGEAGPGRLPDRAAIADALEALLER